MLQKLLSPKWLLVINVVLISLMSATLVAAHGGDTALIHACVASSGAIRIVGANTPCSGKDSALDWNIQGPKGPIGPIGPQGEPGPQGEQGIQGPAGISGLEIAQSQTSLLDSRSYEVTVRCPGGKQAIGGGYQLNGDTNNISVSINRPVGPTDWRVFAATNDYPNTRIWSLTAYVVCANVAP